MPYYVVVVVVVVPVDLYFVDTAASLDLGSPVAEILGIAVGVVERTNTEMEDREIGLAVAWSGQEEGWSCRRPRNQVDLEVDLEVDQGATLDRTVVAVVCFDSAVVADYYYSVAVVMGGEEEEDTHRNRHPPHWNRLST